MTSDHPSPAGVYRARVERFTREQQRIIAQQVSWVLAAGAALLGSFVFARWAVAVGAAVLGLLALVALAVAFVAAFRWWRLLSAGSRAETLKAINEEADSRLERAWDDLLLRHSAAAEPDHAYAADIDIFGRASLFHLLDPALTPTGEATLAQWLTEPATPDQISARQAAAAELVPLLDFRDELAAGGSRIGSARPDIEPFLSWAESSPRLEDKVGYVWAARLSPLLGWGLVAAHIGGLIAWPLWLPFLAVNLVINQAVGGRAFLTPSGLWRHEAAFRQYGPLFKLVATMQFQSPELCRLQDALRLKGTSVHRQIARLHRMSYVSIPLASEFYWPAQMLFVWDINSLSILERWQRVAGPHVRSWLTALGEVEALAALARLSHDNPDWAFPEIDSDVTALEARDLGHPLLPDSVRVTNDIAVGPAGTFLLVTGSNMSGKSTLLRAIGVNAVLANAGGPVCASSYRSPPAELWTSVRIQDSLERGISYFMAELQRLKLVVDAARASAAEGERTFLYLLDEIMQGTNTHERQIAARRIIAHLLSLGAIGAVSTHDLALADTDKLSGRMRAIHFAEQVGGVAEDAAMWFDYKARPGIAQSTNALRLMELAGLDLPD
jgi:hypothetical protein